MLLRFTDNLIMQLTRDCNLRCSYCFQGDKKKWKNKIMSYEDFSRLVDSTIYERCVLGDKDNYINFHFHGGEITLLGSEEIIRRMEYIKKRAQFFNGVCISIQSNGVDFDETLAKYLAENSLVLGLSFDSWINDRLSESKTKEMMNRLKGYHEKYGTKFGLLSTITSKNVKTWLKDNLDLIDWVEMLGVNIVCTNQTDDWLVPTPEDVLNYVYLPIVKSWLTNKPIYERDTKIAAEQILQELLFITEEERKKTGCFNQFCGHLSNMIAVDPDLKLTGCDKYQENGDFIEQAKVLYDIDKKDFLGLNQIREYFNFCKELNEVRKKNSCNQCPADSFCPGQCQSYSLSRFGKVTTIDQDWCKVYNNLFEFIENNWEDIICNMKFQTTVPVLRIRNEAKRRLKEKGIKLTYDPCTRIYKGEKK